MSTKKVKPQLPPKPGQQAKVEADAVLAREEHCRQLRAQLEHLEDLLKKEQEETERLKERVAQVGTILSLKMKVSPNKNQMNSDTMKKMSIQVSI